MSQVLPLAASPGEGKVFDIGPFHIVSRLTGSQTADTFELYELTLAQGAQVDYHVHNKSDETIIVLEGSVEFWVDGKTYMRGPGSAAYAPKGIHHGFANRSDGPVKVLLLFSPSGGQDAYFAGLVEAFSGPEPDLAKIAELQVKYDQELRPLPAA